MEMLGITQYVSLELSGEARIEDKHQYVGGNYDQRMRLLSTA